MYSKVVTLFIACIFLFGCGNTNEDTLEPEDEPSSSTKNEGSIIDTPPVTTPKKDPLASLKINLIFSSPMAQGDYTVRTTIVFADSSNAIANEQNLELVAVQSQTHSITIDEIPIGTKREIKIELFREGQRLFHGFDTVDITSSDANQLSFTIDDNNGGGNNEGGGNDNGGGDNNGGGNDNGGGGDRRRLPIVGRLDDTDWDAFTARQKEIADPLIDGNVRVQYVNNANNLRLNVRATPELLGNGEIGDFNIIGKMENGDKGTTTEALALLNDGLVWLEVKWDADIEGECVLDDDGVCVGWSAAFDPNDNVLLTKID